MEVFLSSLGEKIHPLGVEYSGETWKFYTTGERGRLDELEAKWIALFSDKGTFEILRALRCFDKINEDARLKWRVERQYRAFLAYQGEKEFLEALQKKINDTHDILIQTRATLDGVEKTNEELRDVLRYSADRAEREKAWRALYEVGKKMEPHIKSLVTMRNELAMKLGYRSFYEMQFEIGGLDVQEISSLLNQMDRLSREPYRNYLKEKKAALGVKKLEPWDMRFDPERVAEEMNKHFPKEVLVERVKKTYKSMGFDLDALEIETDLEPRKGKSQHAYSFPIDPPRDVRILANINDGMDTADTLFHEYGHAVYSKHVPAEPWDMREDAGGPMTEGFGQFFGRIVEDETWLRDAAGVPDDLLARYRKNKRDGNLSYLRSSLANLYFERELYRNPDQDLNKLWWKYNAKMTGAGRHEDVAPWGAVVHFTTHPVYLQNYLLADMICDSLWEHMDERGGVAANPELAAYLNEHFFRHGAAYPWQELFQKVLGAPLAPDAYIRHRLGK